MSSPILIAEATGRKSQFDLDLSLIETRGRWLKKLNEKEKKSILMHFLTKIEKSCFVYGNRLIDLKLSPRETKIHGDESGSILLALISFKSFSFSFDWTCKLLLVSTIFFNRSVIDHDGPGIMFWHFFFLGLRKKYFFTSNLEKSQQKNSIPFFLRGDDTKHNHTDRS